VRLAAALLVACTALAAQGAAAAAAAQPHVIHSDKWVGGLQVARATPADARARFGAPSTSRTEFGRSCVQSWRRAGVVLRFLDLSGGAPCRSGVLVTATVTSRRNWRTAVGLRVGDPVSRVRSLYPRARLRGGFQPWAGHWLVTRRTCAEVGGQPYPGLLARVRDGRVHALVVATTACE
jgi:hypothetical protein